MHNDPPVQQCVQAFLNRDYERCAQQAYALVAQGGRLEFTSLFVISAQRYGGSPIRPEFAEQLLSAAARDSWAAALLRLTLGRAEATQVLALAKDDHQRCQAHFYTGIRLGSLGLPRTAGAAFDACLATRVDCPERRLASVEFAALQPGANTDAAGRFQQQSGLLYQMASQTYQQKRTADARLVAIQLLYLVREHESAAGAEDADRLDQLGQMFQAMGDQDTARPFQEQARTIRSRLGHKPQVPAPGPQAPRPDFQLQIKQLHAAVAHLTQQGRLDEAIPLANQLRDVLARQRGDKHPDVAAILNVLAFLHSARGDDAAAESVLEQAVEINRAALGENNLQTAKSLHDLAMLRFKRGQYREAEPLLRRALDVTRTVLGEDCPQLAPLLHNLGSLQGKLGNHAAAEPLLRQALKINQNALGKDHPDCAHVLDALADLLSSRGDYLSAEPLYRQALAIRRAALGQEHPQLAPGLNNLATLLVATGQFGEAEQTFKQALEIARAAQGEDHPDVAKYLTNLAELHRTTGNYVAAESLNRQAIECKRRALGENHPSLAASLNNQAELYRSMGNYRAAEPLFRQALAAFREAYGENHSLVVTALSNLANVCWKLGNHPEADRLFAQAVQAVRAGSGQDHLDHARILRELAGKFESMGDYSVSSSLYQQAVEIAIAKLRPDHPELAHFLDGLAWHNYQGGCYPAAEPTCFQALEIRRAALGEDHPDVASSLNHLALLYAATGRAAEALPLLRQAAAIHDRMIGQVFSIGSESQRMAYLRTLQTSMEVFLSLVRQHLGKAPDAIGAALDLVLRRKALGAESVAAQRDALLGGKYPALEPQLRAWTTLRRQIAQKILNGPEPEGLPAHRQQLARWEQQKEQLEAELARHVPEMNLEQKLRAADRRAVALALPAGVALVEFVRFHVVDFQAVPARGQSRWQPARYLAFVLPAGEPDHVQMIDLGEAEPIDRMVADFRAAITSEVENRTGRDLGAAPVEPVRASGTNPGPALRTAVFDKLVPALAGCTRLLLSPDGDLSRLPFEVLPTADGRRLIEAYSISYLSCGRDVLRFGTTSSSPPAKALVIADPNFDLGNDGLRAAATPGRHSRDLDRGQLRFGRLPGTRIEGERIAALLGVQPWLEAAALEGRLKTCRSPRILHLATHGYFLADQQRDANQEFRDLGAVGLGSGTDVGRLTVAGLENPLLRSGLALAGVNSWLKGDSAPAEAEDGLLTAEDVSGMDLLDTELVVLSACETGLGEVHAGEGVFGLRRAFVLAGAKTLVMSLWKVPDQQTQELMEDFYRRLLGGQGRAEALRQAQLALKARCPHPLYWGAFICQGDAAALPLDAKPKQATQTAQGTLPSPKPTTTKVKWVCPGCGKTLQGETKLSGKRVKCPSCSTVHAVPGTPA